MQNEIIAGARALATQSGAHAVMLRGVAHDTDDSRLAAMAESLLPLVEATGIDLLALCWDGETLLATVDDSRAEEPLCPNAFARFIRRLSYAVLGEALDSRLTIAEPAVVEHPLHLVA